MQNLRGLVVLFCYLALCITRCGDPTPGCPNCTDALQPNNTVVPASTEVLGLRMKWVALAGAPSIDDPNTLCEDNFRDVLMRRHARASGCVWTEQCRIALTPLLAADPDYALLPDPDPSVGQPGDVAINNDNSMTQEMIDLVTAADAHYASDPQGLTAIAIRRFVYPNGDPAPIRGYANDNGGVRPFLIVVDPAFYVSQSLETHRNTEQVLAHEVGHALSLCHTNEGNCNDAGNGDQTDNLMLTPGNARNRALLESQCDLARNTHAIVFTQNNGQQSLRRYAFDNNVEDQLSAKNRFADIDRLAWLPADTDADETALELATRGFSAEKRAAFWIGFDTDDNAQTGGAMARLAPGIPQDGAEFAAYIQFDAASPTVQLFRFANGEFQPFESGEERVKIEAQTQSGYAYGDAGCTSQPVSETITLRFSRTTFAKLARTAPSELPRTLTLQAASVVKDEGRDEVVDVCGGRVIYH